MTIEIPRLYSLARMTTATTGTGTITLGSAATVNSVTYLSFSASGVQDGDIVAYGIADASNSEYGYGTYTSSGTTLTRNVIRSTNSNNAISLSGSAQVFITAGGSDLLFHTLGNLRNFSIAATVAANALTIAIKDQSGADPTALSPVYLDVRSATVTSGIPSSYAIRSATSLVVSSGSTLGTTASTAFALWVVLFNDTGTLRLGIINPTTTTLDETAVASSTAEGGAGGADSANTFYTDTAVTSKAFRVIGSLVWSSGLETPGTWSSGPTSINSFSTGAAAFVPVRGPSIQTFTSGSGTYTTPAGVKWLRVRMVGGGGGGGGSGTSPGAGTAGGNTTFGSLTANGGSPSSSATAGGNGGTASGGNIANIAGARGSDSSNSSSVSSGPSGGTILGPPTGGAIYGGSVGRSAPANSGSGGSGATSSIGVVAAAAGGGGGYCESIILNPDATYSYAVGANGSGGSAGTSGSAGGAGGSGVIIVEEYYYA